MDGMVTTSKLVLKTSGTTPRGIRSLRVCGGGQPRLRHSLPAATSAGQRHPHLSGHFTLEAWPSIGAIRSYLGLSSRELHAKRFGNALGIAGLTGLRGLACVPIGYPRLFIFFHSALCSRLAA